jgi:hypothetical protein
MPSAAMLPEIGLTSVVPNDSPVRIGSNTYNSFNGYLDEIRVYNTALSEAEIAGLRTSIPEPATLLILAVAGIPAVCRKWKKA